jgi:hypothetical protein
MSKTNGNGSAKDAAARKAVLEKLRAMSATDVFAVAVRAGIYDSSGKLEKPYASDAPASQRDD